MDSSESAGSRPTDIAEAVNRGGVLLSGPLRRALLHVALPAAAFQVLVFLNNVVDFLWVRMLGDEAAAGQTQGWTLFWMLASVAQIFSTGTVAIVARRVGEGRYGEANHASRNAARGAVLAGLVIGAAGWFLIPWVAGLNDSSPKATGYTIDYLRMVFAGAPVMFVFYAIEGTFKGHGDMRRPLRALGIALAINAVLDPILIHVAGLEVLGAGLATVAAFTITGLLLGVSASRRGWLKGRPGLDLRLVARVLRIGTPLSIHGIVFSGVYVVVITEVTKVGGDAATSALGLGLRVEGLAYMLGVGFATAAAAVVGQNLGAGQINRAHKGAWTAVRLAVWGTGAWGLLMLLAPPSLVEWMSSGPLAGVYATDYLRIVAISLSFTAVEIVLEGAFSGAGDTVPPMLLGIPLTLARIPAAMFASAMDWGFGGIIWALTVTSVIRGLLFAFWFARGQWINAKA